MSQNLSSPKDHLDRVREYCDTLADKKEAKALLDLALQTSLGPEALEVIRQRILTEGISWNWVNASFAEIMYAQIELNRMVEINREQMLIYQKELLEQYRADLFSEQHKVLKSSIQAQEETLKRINLLVHSLGPNEKIAHEFVRSILDTIIQTTHEVWADKASTQTRELVESFSVANNYLIDRIEKEIQNMDGKSNTVAFTIGDHIEKVLTDRLEAFDASSSKNLVAYKAHLTSTANLVRTTLDEFKSIRVKTQWITLLKGPIATVLLVLSANALSLTLYYYFTH